MAVNPTSLRVDIRSQYTCSPDTSKVTIDDADMYNVLKITPEESLRECQNRFPEMTWMDVAKAIAKNVYRVDINDAQAWELAKILIKDNKMSGWEKFNKYGLGCGCAHVGDSTKVHYYFKWEGNFPNKITVKISADFKKKIAEIKNAKPEKQEKKHGTQGSQGTQGSEGSHIKPPELSITVKTPPLKVKLQAVLPQGFIATSIEWNFKDTIMTGTLEVERKYDLEHQGPHDVTFKATDANGKIMSKTAWFTITDMGKGY